MSDVVGTEHRGQLGVQDPHGDAPAVLSVVREEYTNHPAAPELTLQLIVLGARPYQKRVRA